MEYFTNSCLLAVFKPARIGSCARDVSMTEKWSKLLGGQKSRTSLREPQLLTEGLSSSLRTKSVGDDGSISPNKSRRPKSAPRLYSNHDSSRQDSEGPSSPGVFNFPEPNQIWYSPSMEQVLEALCVGVMAAKSSNQPLDPKFNAYISYLIEDYGRLRKRLENLEQDSAAESLRREMEQKVKADVVAELSAQVATHKAEIKRLELLIHKSSGDGSDGMEAVMVARSGSLLRRSGKVGEAVRHIDDGRPE